jgi:hypothetical protein
VSAGLDRSMALWSCTGAKVGLFGSHTWQLDDRGTWQNTAECRVEVGTCFFDGGQPLPALVCFVLQSGCGACGLQAMELACCGYHCRCQN